MSDPFEPEDPTELSEDDDQENLIDPLDALLRQHEPAPIITGPDGGFVPQMALIPEPIPAATPQSFLCLRGPCRYYLERRYPAQVGNTKGTFDRPLVQIERHCHRMNAVATSLMDELVSECNEWHPYMAEEVSARDAAREAVKAAHPDWFTKGNGQS